MSVVDRRRFIQLGGIGAGLGLDSIIPELTPRQAALARGNEDERLVRLSGDGLGLTPAQYARLLLRLAEEKGITKDSYSVGGIVEQLENQCAQILGKERAIFMPTGTLAKRVVRPRAGPSSATP